MHEAALRQHAVLREEEVFACVVASADLTGSRDLAEGILAAAAARLALFDVRDAKRNLRSKH